MLARRTLIGLDLSPDASGTAIKLSDLIDLSKINVLSAPVDTHSEQSGDGNTVTRGGRRRSLLNLDVSPGVSPKVSLTDLLELSKINVLSAPVDTHSEQSGDGNTVTRGGRRAKRTLGLAHLLSSLDVSDSDISSLNLGDIDVSPDVSPDVDLSDLIDLSTINVLSAPVDTHSEQSGDGNTVVRGGRKARRSLGLAGLVSNLGLSDNDIAKLDLSNVNASPDVSPDVDLSDLLNLDTINVLSAPVDTHSEQSGDDNTVVRGGRMIKVRKAKK